ncbi:AAA family ATPase [Acidiferrobacter sp.]|uniref:ExeA family protein n=1 Tax=Acidiferrobacter sp. TaxID=1872107 RepID=UPI00263765B9|nr:AAA family ATPase [Acidiferrobacter sp.]
MYERYFGLRELPFGLTPDTEYYFAHADQQEALNTLLAAVRMGEGFLKVTGEVGTGKTLLCRKLLAMLAADAQFMTAYIPNPTLDPLALIEAIATELAAPPAPGQGPHALARNLAAHLIECCAQGRRVVLCLDEVQAMPVETLESLRLISNLETEKRKLIQIILFGQPELDTRLEDRAVRQLRQRIAFSCRLGPLSLADTDDYLRHRLHVAGYEGPALFGKRALRVLYRASGGIPRLANILAHKSLMVAYGEGSTVVRARHMRLACADTEAVRVRPGFLRLAFRGRR